MKTKSLIIIASLVVVGLIVAFFVAFLVIQSYSISYQKVYLSFILRKMSLQYS